ncbi:hypothetical protein ACFQ7N_36875 [Streptomyces niveus]|uniref:hypothetical protein n=1 Tax=Streptomyces niveus TaxID=193462 RepID=UPI0036AB9288
MPDITNAERAARAEQAVAAYTEAVQAAHLGTYAVEAYARASPPVPQFADPFHDVIGELVDGLLHLRDRAASAAETDTIAALIRSTRGAPGAVGHAVADVITLVMRRPGPEPIAETAAVALLAAAVFHDIDVRKLLLDACDAHAKEKEGAGPLRDPGGCAASTPALPDSERLRGRYLRLGRRVRETFPQVEGGFPSHEIPLLWLLLRGDAPLPPRSPAERIPAVFFASHTDPAIVKTTHQVGPSDLREDLRAAEQQGAEVCEWNGRDRSDRPMSVLWIADGRTGRLLRTYVLTPKRGRCRECGDDVPLTSADAVSYHEAPGAPFVPCDGSARLPRGA